jgi:hypothetical protein
MTGFDEAPPRSNVSSAITGVLGPPELRIVLRPIASPMPLGFYTVAIATVVVSALQLGIIPADERNEVALLILPAFALQLIVGIACIAGRDAIAATLMASFAGTWLADSLSICSVSPESRLRKPSSSLLFAHLSSCWLSPHDQRQRSLRCSWWPPRGSSSQVWKPHPGTRTFLRPRGPLAFSLPRLPCTRPSRFYSRT